MEVLTVACKQFSGTFTFLKSSANRRFVIKIPKYYIIWGKKHVCLSKGDTELLMTRNCRIHCICKINDRDNDKTIRHGQSRPVPGFSSPQSINFPIVTTRPFPYFRKIIEIAEGFRLSISTESV